MKEINFKELGTRLVMRELRDRVYHLLPVYCTDSYLLKIMIKK
jgi:hypothetical protein